MRSEFIAHLINTADIGLLKEFIDSAYYRQKLKMILKKSLEDQAKGE